MDPPSDLTYSFGKKINHKLQSAGIEALNGDAIAMARSRCIPNVFEIKAFTAFFPGDFRPDIFGIPIVINGASSNH